MTLYFVPGRGMVNIEGEERVPLDAQEVPSYKVGDEYLQWSPDIDRPGWTMPERQNAPAGYVSQLMDLYQKAQQGTLAPEEQRPWQLLEREARAIPARDLSRVAWHGEGSAALDPFSPDIGPLLLGILERQRAGSELSPNETEILSKAQEEDVFWSQRAGLPQESDVDWGFGDNLFGALAILGLAASAGTAAPLFVPGTSLAGTLGGIGSLAGTAGTVTGMAGEALHIPQLSKAGSVLGALGGLAGGAGGIANLWGTGIQSLSDAAKLAQSASKITGSLGRLSGVEPLRQAAKYLGYAGQAGTLASGVLPTSFTDWSGTNSPLAANVAPGVKNLLSAADQVTQRGGGRMAEGDWLDFETDDWWRGGADVGANYSSGSGTLPTTWDAYQAGNYANTTYAPFGAPGGGSLEDQVRQMISQRPDLYGTSVSSGAGGGGGFLSTLGGLASGALGFLGKNAGVLGPLASAIGGGVAANVGSGAARDAGRLQADALNRGIDLQTAQWLQQQANQAPWMEAGRGALGELTWRQGVEEALPMPDATAAIAGANYQLPDTTPGWTPQNFDVGAYRWSPGQGPSAANYRYTPGRLPDAAEYASGPPQLYQGAMPGTQVPTLTGQQVLDQDPGAAFRQTEARKALEGSAAARGNLLSGGNLKALQDRSQDLASQEYQNAWQRMMGRDVEQYGRNWGQYLQAWNQGVQGTQLGLETNAQNFGQAMSAAQLREQVMQVASQQGWSQAQAEAAFREQMAQASSQQGFQQGLAGTQWNQQQQQQWQQEQYERMMRDVQTRYGWDTAQNTTDYQREQAAYQQRLAEQQRQWNTAASLAGIGQTATNQVGNQGAYSTEALGKLYGQLGTAQGASTIGQALPWQSAIGGAVNNLPSLFRSLNA